MKEKYSVQKNDDENPIPNVWRNTLYQIIEALKDENYSVLIAIPNVTSLSKDEVKQMTLNIKDYGAHLINLSEETWSTSVCRWQGGNVWDLLIDLYTREEGKSDLVLAVRIFEEGVEYRFSILDIYVP